MQGVPNTSKIMIFLPQNIFSENINKNELEIEPNKEYSPLRIHHLLHCWIGNEVPVLKKLQRWKSRTKEQQGWRPRASAPVQLLSSTAQLLAAPTANWELWDGEVQPVGVAAVMLSRCKYTLDIPRACFGRLRSLFFKENYKVTTL